MNFEFLKLKMKSLRGQGKYNELYKLISENNHVAEAIGDYIRGVFSKHVYDGAGSWAYWSTVAFYKATRFEFIEVESQCVDRICTIATSQKDVEIMNLLFTDPRRAFVGERKKIFSTLITIDIDKVIGKETASFVSAIMEFALASHHFDYLEKLLKYVSINKIYTYTEHFQNIHARALDKDLVKKSSLNWEKLSNLHLSELLSVDVPEPKNHEERVIFIKYCLEGELVGEIARKNAVVMKYISNRIGPVIEQQPTQCPVALYEKFHIMCWQLTPIDECWAGRYRKGNIEIDIEIMDDSVEYKYGVGEKNLLVRVNKTKCKKIFVELSHLKFVLKKCKDLADIFDVNKFPTFEDYNTAVWRCIDEYQARCYKESKTIFNAISKSKLGEK